MRRFSVVTAAAAVLASLFLCTSTACSRVNAEDELTAHVESRISMHLKKIQKDLKSGHVAQRLP